MDSEIRWKNIDETTTEEGHKVFFGEKENKQEHGVGVPVHKDIVNTVTGCRPVSSRLITIRLRTVPFNLTAVQAYVLTSNYDDNEREKKSTTSCKMSLMTHRRRTGMQKWARMLMKTGKAFVDPSAMMTQIRKDSDFWSLPPLIILC